MLTPRRPSSGRNGRRMEDADFMRLAIDLSRRGMESGAGGPFGAVVVRDGVVVGEGYNRVTSTNDPTAHAEVVAVRDACQRLATFSLDGATIYASCEPCPICLASIYWARIGRLVFANTSADAASIGFDDAFFYDELRRPARERRVGATALLRDEAYEVFEQWRRKQDKIAY